MSQARKLRTLVTWRRYVARYITPERGGMLDNAEPVGYVKAMFRTAHEPWTWETAYWERRARRSR
jgi:hypothetical protein